MNNCKDSNIHRGMIIFQNKCQRCHSIRKNESAQHGPNLFGVFGRIAGSTGFYGHSQQLKNSKIIWNRPNLERYLKNPKHHSKVPGNVMFHGAAVPATAGLVVSFLESLSPKAPISTENKPIRFKDYCKQLNSEQHIFSPIKKPSHILPIGIPPMIPLQWQWTIDSDASDLDITDDHKDYINQIERISRR
eukprot:412769_1